MIIVHIQPLNLQIQYLNTNNHATFSHHSVGNNKLLENSIEILQKTFSDMQMHRCYRFVNEISTNLGKNDNNLLYDDFSTDSYEHVRNFHHRKVSLAELP
jgi:hypothetical protein